MMFYQSETYNNSVNKFYKFLHYLISTPLSLFLVIFTLSTFSFCFSQSTGISSTSHKWVGTWSTAPQLVEKANNPPSPGLSNNTIRQIVTRFNWRG